MTNVTVFFQEKKDGSSSFSKVQQRDVLMASIERQDDAEAFCDELAWMLTKDFSEIHIMSWKIN